MATVVLLSAGLDSAVNLKEALDREGVALALTSDYGQRAAAREAACAALMCDRLGVRHRLIPLPWLRDLCKNALVGGGMVPEVTADELDSEMVKSGETARAVWVPNRNGVFVGIAASFAESLGAGTVVAGFNREEAATFPDNSAEFVAATNAQLGLSTRTGVMVHSYTQDATKSEIVRLGRRIGAPVACVWSCYLGYPEHCWRCESCARLERALREAGAWEWFHAQRRLP